MSFETRRAKQVFIMSGLVCGDNDDLNLRTQLTARLDEVI